MAGCETCGEQLAPNKAPGRRRRFCSERCRKAQYDLVCVDCGGRVDGTTPGRMSDRAEPVCLSCAGEHYAIWTRDAITLCIETWADEHDGVAPTATDFRDASASGLAVPTPTTVANRFGTWNAGVEAAGLACRPRGCYGREGEDPDVVADTARLYRTGLSVYAVARALDISRSGVTYRLEKAGERVRPSARAQYPVETRAALITLYRSGTTIQQAADAIGVAYVTARRWLIDAGVQRRHSTDYRRQIAA